MSHPTPGLIRLQLTPDQSEQRQDWSSANDASHLTKEDDPLLATTLAVIALSRRRE